MAQNVATPKAIQRQMHAMPFAKLLRQAREGITPEMVKVLNSVLNKIDKV